MSGFHHCEKLQDYFSWMQQYCNIKVHPMVLVPTLYTEYSWDTGNMMIHILFESVQLKKASEMGLSHQRGHTNTKEYPLKNQ